MSRLTLAVAITVVGLGFTEARADDPPKKKATVVGSWRLLSIDGREVVPTVYTFAADGTLQVSGQAGMARATSFLKYSTDEKTDPARIDYVDKDAVYLGKDSVYEGLFKVEGDTLTICHRNGRNMRPKKFGEERATQEVFERIKPKD
jgi:uncharacterized protein (TIGR03067 family)